MVIVVIDKINVIHLFILLYIFFTPCYTIVIPLITNIEKVL